MPHSYSKIIISGIIVLALVAVGLQRSKNQTSDTETLRIGTSLALTGPAAFIGESYRDGLQLARDEINRSGGVNGQKIELIFEDNKNLPQEGVTVFQALRAQNPDLLYTTMSAPSVPFSSVAKDSGIPLFVTAVFADVLKDNPNAVSFFPTVSDDAKATLVDMKKNNITKVAVLYLNSEYGLANYNAFVPQAKASGVEIVASDSFLGDVVDFTTPVTKLLATNPQAVYVIAINSNPIIDTIKAQSKARNQEVGIYGNSIPVLGSLVYKAPATYDGVHLTAAEVTIPGTAKFKAFRAKFTDQSKVANNTLGYASIGYDSLHIIDEVLEKKPTIKDFVASYMSFGKFKGVNGEVNLSARAVGVPVYPVVIKNGTIEQVK